MVRSLRVLILILSLSYSSWGEEVLIVPQIMGGFTEPPGSEASRSVISITESDGVEYCTGVVIGPHLALTAAHCIEGRESVFLKNNGKIFAETKEIILHPRFERDEDDWAVRASWDIAMLVFAVELPREMRPAQIVGITAPLELGMSFKISGYGNGSDSAVRPDTTELFVSRIFPRGRSFLLDTARDHGVCYGDSGAPAYIIRSQQMLVYGLASHFIGQPRQDCSADILFTDLRAFAEWIDHESLARGIKRTLPIK